MSIKDPMIHPAFLDPRQWADVNLYDTIVNIEREPLSKTAHHTPDRPFAIKHLKLELGFDLDQQRVSGAALLTIVPMNDGFRSFDLDAAEMNIAGVKLIRIEKRGTGDLIHSAAHHGANLEFETGAEKLSVELGREFSRNDYLIIEISYSCSPRKGLFFIKPDASYPDKPQQIWSQGQNEDAHWWFPCHDITSQKMTTELIATVKSDFFVLSNGELIGVRENSHEGTRTYHWSQAQPHPAYLVSVVIGKFEHIPEKYEGLPIDYYVYRDRKGQGQKLFARTPQMIKFFEEMFGYAYPYPKYAQVIVDDFLFGAMENTSATTMTDRCLLDENAAIDINYDDIVAHELAHQWWGNLVTCKDWSQIWLNESFATYSEYLWREHSVGQREAQFVLFQDFLTYLREDMTSHRRPIVCNRYRFSEEVMDRHAYEKGECILDMLRRVLGDEGFFRSLAHYLNKFEFGVAETNDFKVAIEEATGQNLHWFFDQWLYGAGYPELDVSYQWQREQKVLQLSVHQTQKGVDTAPFFRFPVEIEIVTVETGEVLETERRANYKVVVEKAEQEFYFPCDSKPRMVVFDKGERVFKLLHFPKTAQELIFQLNRDEEMMGRLRAARELSAYKVDDVAAALRAVLLGRDFYGVRMAAAISLGEIGGDNARAALIEAYRNSDDPRVRRTCILSLGNLKDEVAVDFLKDALERDRSYFVAVAAVRGLANIGSDRAYDILLSSITRTSWQEVIAAATFHGLALAKQRRVIDPAIDYSRYGKPAPIRVAAIGCLGVLGKELNKEAAADRIIDHLIGLLKDKNIRARVSAIRALGKIGNSRALLALRQSQQNECLDQLKAALIDAIEAIEKKGENAKDAK